MPDDILGGQGATLLMAIVIVAIALLALVAVFWLIRARSSSTFIRGGRARQPRLAVLDAAAVDTRRRIVLIRRDDVEHLVMIGGLTDVVIESRIVQSGDPAAAAPKPPRAAVQAQAPARAEPAGGEPASPRPAPARQPVSNAERASWEEPARVQPKPAAIASAPAASQPATRALSAKDRPAGTQSPLSPVSYGAAAGALSTATAIKADPGVEAEAADILESARSRVFEEQPPSREPETPALIQSPRAEEAPQHTAGQQAYAEPAERTPVAATSEPRLQAPAGYDEILSDDDFGADDWDFEDPFDEPAPTAQTGPQTVPQPPQQTNTPADPGLDFESVLAAELSDDLAGNPFVQETVGEQKAAEPTPPEAEPAPEVQGETKPSRDTLEAEMERLLGDLSRKP